MNEVKKEDIIEGLKNLAIPHNGIVMVHSSLFSLGYVVGGADTVIDAFFEYLYPEGTLAMPTLCQKDKEKRFETWDIEKSPSDVGKITEVFRLRPGSIRSNHPTHSVAACGPKAKELIAGHEKASGRPSPWGEASFGYGSPWEKLYLWNAYYLFLGVTLKVNTMGHFVQAMLGKRYLEKAGKHIQEIKMQLRNWKKPGIWPDYDFAGMELILKQKGLIIYGKIGNAILRLTRAGNMVAAIIEELENHSGKWLKQDFIDWKNSIVTLDN